jgi:hypothetical protein
MLRRRLPQRGPRRPCPRSQGAPLQPVPRQYPQFESPRFCLVAGAT